MNTPSHLIMTAALQRALPHTKIVTSAFLIGAIAPDLPLYLLSLVGIVYFHYGLGWSGADTARHMYSTLFYEDPVWIALHNALHSFVVIFAALLLAKFVAASRPRLSQWIYWFMAACLLHTVVDIFTHVDDGPVFLWPLSSHFRFYSAISYWDPKFYGRQFAIFELLFDLTLLSYLVLPWLRGRLARRSKEAPTVEDEGS